MLSGFDPSGLDADSLLTVLGGLERIVAAAHAAQAKAMAEFTRLRQATPGRSFGEFVADEIAVELSVSRRVAENRVAQAVELTTRVPAVFAALQTGAVDLYRAKVITDATYRLDDATAARVATHVVDQVAGCNASEVRRVVRRAVLQSDPDGARRRQERARADRSVTLTPLDDGMAELTALLPAEQATAAYQRIDTLARSGQVPGNERGADARRADTLVNLLLGRRDPGVGEPCGLRPLVHVTVAASTLAGADDKPGMLDRYGPIPAAFARAIASDPTGTWKRLVTDPVDGSLIEHSRNTYRPPAALDDFVRARDARCRFPGCQHSAQHADLDHTIPWPAGPTTAGNLGAVCRHHHRLKHQTSWRLTQTHGRFHWTSPTGRHYTTEPENHDPPPPAVRGRHRVVRPGNAGAPQDRAG
ncbi:MAG TPA: DUF222 domain-containing protein [Mycobacteriales bacterium]|nr:DUF222 domain-containing protein [Mycobacteriales bacterium]